LYALFGQVIDPRRPRGIPHHVAAVLTVMVFAVLAGARNFREAGDRAADLPPLLLHAAGTRCDPRGGELVAPRGSTLRRVVQDIDHSRGRTVHRQIWATDADGIDFPGAAQVFRIRRDVFDPFGQRISKV